MFIPRTNTKHHYKDQQFNVVVFVLRFTSKSKIHRVGKIQIYVMRCKVLILFFYDPLNKHRLFGFGQLVLVTDTWLPM